MNCIILIWSFRNKLLKTEDLKKNFKRVWLFELKIFFKLFPPLNAKLKIKIN